ncbi:MAG TPA: stage II sporulation protein M [Ferruginibacter sp.]|nr:stage II sporulation protein M [Ferruginibacter sp.]
MALLFKIDRTLREALFIKRNAEKWKTYQHEPARNPDEQAERFMTLIDDLSYAKTFYPKSKVTRWINSIAASIYQGIYSNRKEKYSRIFQFWKYELPLLFRKYHRIFLFTTVAFCLFVTVGVFSSIHNPEFVRGVLGDGYVDMTEENIANGDPFGVYKDNSPFNMFIRIAVNNIRVSFLTFMGGFSFGFFTIYLMWSNGIMLGCFEYLFFSQGLGMQSVLVIWIHGTIEIGSIIIAGAAGFILANGILFPGTYSRMASFRRGAKDAVKVLICLIPFFITAAFLESYITHLMSQTYDKADNTGLPVWASILILASSLWLMVWYFVIWPLKLSKRGKVQMNDGIVARLNQPHA